MHRHIALRSRLLQSVESANGEQLLKQMNCLSNADFRTASVLLSEDLLILFPNNFWTLMLYVVPHHNKAFLGTFLKAFSRLCKVDRDFLINSLKGLSLFSAKYASDIDKRKCLEAALPFAPLPEDVKTVIQAIYHKMDVDVMPFLFKASTPACYFVLFQLIKMIDEDKELIKKYCLALMHDGNSRSFNMACILRTYFGLDSLPGTFSLKIHPYELGRLDESFEHFCKILDGKPLG